MADHMYKPWEVPKGERWEYFLDYYKKPCIFIACCLLALFSILKSVFAPAPDLIILAAASTNYTDETVWTMATDAMKDMPFDFNGDDDVLAEVNYVYFDMDTQTQDPEVFMASQTRLSASIATAESALQIVDAGTIGYFEEQGLMACYNELPTLTEHDSDELIKIPLHELKPFRDIDELPDGLFMTLRPKELMQLGNSKKKLANYENQVAALLAMMEE